MTPLITGDKAPAFTGKNQDGQTISLKDFLGKKVVLYFYPKNFTPGCTAEACNLRDNEAALKDAGMEVIGVSPDDIESHKKFEEKYELPFNLIADPDKKIIEKYGVWGEKNMYGKKSMGIFRTTFLIDEKGMIYKIFKKPKTAVHSEEILKASSALK
jgi:peroxiredoxin Q/BCP